MTDAQFATRTTQLLQAEADSQEAYWWLSYASKDGFLGGIFVRARGFMHAVLKVQLLGINPGGEIQGVEIPDGCPVPRPEFSNRLLTKEEADDESILVVGQNDESAPD